MNYATYDEEDAEYEDDWLFNDSNPLDDLTFC